MDETTKPSWKRLFGGAIAAAALAASVLALYTPLDRGGLSVAHFGVALFLFYFALPAVLVIGLPLYSILRALGWVRWWSSALAGVLGGALVTVILRLPSAPNPRDFALTCAVGAASALVFWWVVRARR